MKSAGTESTDNRPEFFEHRPMIVCLITIAPCRDGMMQTLLTGGIRLP